MKLARMLGITMSLLTHDKITAKEFASKYEVSQRTILRDMDELSAAGIPIVARQGNTGGFSILESFKLEKNFLTTDEMEILRSLLRGFKDSILDEESEGILNKLSTIGGNKPCPEVSNETMVMDFSGWADPIHLKNMVTVLKKSIEELKVVEIQYFNNNGYESIRKIHPCHLLLKNSTWYVHGFCQRAKDYRIFKLTRIKVIHETEEVFEKHSVEAPTGESFLGNSKVSETIKLKFQKEAFSRLFDFFDKESMTFLDSGEIIVNVEFPIDEWIYFHVLSFGTYVEVLEPEWLRKEMVKRIKSMVDIYQD